MFEAVSSVNFKALLFATIAPLLLVNCGQQPASGSLNSQDPRCKGALELSKRLLNTPVNKTEWETLLSGVRSEINPWKEPFLEDLRDGDRINYISHHDCFATEDGRQTISVIAATARLGEIRFNMILHDEDASITSLQIRRYVGTM